MPTATYQSRQDYQTPPAFIKAVEKRFGPITTDCACTDSNSVNPTALSFTPLNSFLLAKEEDLTRQPGVLYLNPPFKNIPAFAKKVRKLSPSLPGHSCFAMLTPASICTNWFIYDVQPYAFVYQLMPRLCFDGQHPYPKDLILSVFRNHEQPGLQPWHWRKYLGK